MHSAWASRAAVSRGRHRRGSTAADLPPSSRVQRAIRSPQSEAIRRPAAVEPVKVILSTRGSRTSSSDTSRSAVTTLRTPGGSPISSATSATRYPSPGASGDDLRITVQPAMQGGGDLVADQAERAVPRDDGPHHADGLAHQQPEPGLLGCGLLVPTRTCRPARRRSRTCPPPPAAGVLGDLVEHAGLAGPDLADVVGPCRQPGAHGPQVLRPLGVGHPGPGPVVEGLARRRPRPGPCRPPGPRPR